MNAWMLKHRDLAREFPKIGAKIKDLSTSFEALIGRQAELKARAAGIERSSYSKFLKSAHVGDLTDSEAIARLIKKPSIAAGTLGNDGVLRRGLSRAVWDHSFKQSDPLKFITQNRNSLVRLLGGGRDGARSFGNARKIANALRKTQLASPDIVTDISSQPGLQSLEGFLNMGLSSISNRFFSIKSGRVPKHFVAIDMLSRFARGYSKRESDAVLMDALLNPETADRLIQSLRSPKNIEKAKRLHTYLISTGLVSVKDDEDE